MYIRTADIGVVIAVDRRRYGIIRQGEGGGERGNIGIIARHHQPWPGKRAGGHRSHVIGHQQHPGGVVVQEDPAAGEGIHDLQVGGAAFRQDGLQAEAHDLPNRHRARVAALGGGAFGGGDDRLGQRGHRQGDGSAVAAVIVVLRRRAGAAAFAGIGAAGAGRGRSGRVARAAAARQAGVGQESRVGDGLGGGHASVNGGVIGKADRAADRHGGDGHIHGTGSQAGVIGIGIEPTATGEGGRHVDRGEGQQGGGQVVQDARVEGGGAVGAGLVGHRDRVGHHVPGILRAGRGHRLVVGAAAEGDVWLLHHHLDGLGGSAQHSGAVLGYRIGIGAHVAQVVAARGRVIHQGVEFDHHIFDVGVVLQVGDVAQLEAHRRAGGIGVAVAGSVVGDGIIRQDEGRRDGIDGSIVASHRQPSPGQGGGGH